MKKSIKFLSLLGFLCLFILPGTALAIDPPTVNDIPEYVDAELYLITGKTEPNATIVISGGQYNMAPVETDSSGSFEIIFNLVQNDTNTFYIRANLDGETSERTEIVINESREEAEKLADEGIDAIAPDAPVLDTYEIETDETMVSLTGTGEPGSNIVIDGEEEIFINVIDDEGNIAINVFEYDQNAVNTYLVYARDESGNISTASNLTITHGDPSLESTIADPFTDIDGHWAYEYIEYLRLAGVISGYGDGTFGPNNPITRAEITKIALGAFEYLISNNVTENPFPDVEKDLWYAKYIKAAQESQIVEGYPDGTFQPLNNVSRIEALKILLGAGEIDVGTSENIQFDDTEPGMWYSTYLSYAVENGIVQGYDGNLFKPTQDITRAEICKITVKIIELKEDLDSLPTI